MKETPKRLSEWSTLNTTQTSWGQGTFPEYFRFGENNILHYIPSQTFGRNNSVI